jgi:hypothetical protein
MKNSLKLTSKALLLFSILFFTSCVNDDFINNQNLPNENKISSRYINFNEVKRNLKVFDKFKNVQEKINQSKSNSLNQNARLVYLSQFDFSIVTDKILLIEKEGYKSYTFPIYRDNETDKTENLVITESNGFIKAYISKYDLTENDKASLENNQYVDLRDKTEISSLEENSSGEPCYGLVYEPLEWNEQGQVTVSLVWIVEIECPEDEGNSGGGSSGGGSSGGGSWGGGWFGGGWSGGGGSTGGNPSDGGDSSNGGGSTGGGGSDTGGYPSDGNLIITSPVLPLDNDPKTIKHLMSLVENKSDGSKTNIKTRIDQLNTARLTSLKENGYMFDNNQNTHLSYNQGPNWTAWADPGTSYFIMVHMHQDNYIPEGTTTPKPTNVAPSPADVRGLMQLLNYTGNRNATSIIVSRQGTFAIRVNDKSKVNDAFNAISPANESNQTWVDFIDEYDKLVTDLYLANPSDNTNIMNGFIKFINSHSINGQTMGLSFYQAVYDSQGNIINWVKL